MSGGESSPQNSAAQRLLDSLSDDELKALNVRFEQDPNSLSPEEVAALYLWTRRRILKFEAKALKRGRDDDPSND